MSDLKGSHSIGRYAALSRTDLIPAFSDFAVKKEENSEHSSEAPWREFPGDLVVRTPCFQCPGPRFNPWSGNQDPIRCTR